MIKLLFKGITIIEFGIKLLIIITVEKLNKKSTAKFKVSGVKINFIIWFMTVCRAYLLFIKPNIYYASL